VVSCIHLCHLQLFLNKFIYFIDFLLDLISTAAVDSLIEEAATEILSILEENIVDLKMTSSLPNWMADMSQEIVDSNLVTDKILDKVNENKIFLADVLESELITYSSQNLIADVDTRDLANDVATKVLSKVNQQREFVASVIEAEPVNEKDNDLIAETATILEAKRVVPERKTEKKTSLKKVILTFIAVALPVSLLKTWISSL